MRPERFMANIGARIKEFQRKMKQVDAAVKKAAMGAEVQVDADTAKAKRKMITLQAVKQALSRKVVIPIEARANKFQQTMNRIANNMQAIDTIMRNSAGGTLLMISPAAIPIIASAVGLIGTLGPMIGVLGGSTFALATAFGLAGSAAIAFGAVAIPTISKLFDETKRLTGAQKAAKAEYTKFQSTWAGITKDLEKPVLQAFSKSMQFANKTLQMARPLFDGAATAVNNLLNSLNKSLDSSPVKAFFDYMNKNAGPMLETTGKAIGNFLQGLMSMMAAFGPLADQTAHGFLKMSQGFSDWASGLSKSEKFQSFVNYINQNMPKLRSIFSDFTVGIVNMFSAFGPLASDMMTGLQGMMGKFKEWSTTLSKNQQFQKFIGYIRENTPQVLSLIGNLTTFLINLGVGLAPIGSAILGIVNNTLSWIDSMMLANPVIGQAIAVVAVLAGALIAFAPNIIAIATLFKGFGGLVGGAFTKILSVFLPFKGSFMLGMKMIGQSIGRLAVQFLAGAARIAASWIIAMGPVGWVIATVIALVALVIANWDTVKSWTLKIWNAVSQFISETVSKIAGYIKEKFPELYNVIKSYMEYSQKVISAVWNYVKSTFENVLSFLKALVKGDFQGMKDAIRNQMEAAQKYISNIWNAIDSFFSSVLGDMWSTVKQNFSDMVSSVRDKMTEIKGKIENLWEKAQSFLEGIDLFEIGKNIIEGLIGGIGDMAGSLVKKVEGVVGNAVEAAKNLLGVHSPSRVFMQIGKYTGQGMVNGMDGMRNAISKASVKMASAALIEPQRTEFAFDAGLNTSDFGRIRHDIGAEVSSFEMPDPTINVYNEWDGEKVVSYVERGSAKRSRITDGFGGK